ncbi:MAG: carboxypeptidase regulatory-like domain-containing protein [Holophagales bacterium]|nr:carboxypeptidase regulatory-like domain-containing protein [Holophagales bacterium]MYG31757.1 carboxypeptidase regulatory-like domain-containing protein [Holophagales bacterium]MYI79599.1 carboxypeptidase regulatory-like domain-containing protein [Holophagales bacterium]
MTIGRLLLALAVVLTAAAPAPAQEWSGSNGFRVVVTDDAGQPLPGVTVMVLLAEPDRSGGPPPLLTDASGVAEVSGLSAGEWQVELRREGFMIVSSYLRLEDGKRPQVGFTSRQRTGPFWAPMNVGYSSVGVATTTARAGSPRAISRAQRRAERRAAQRERRLRSENVARVVERPPEPPEVPAPQPVAVAEQPVAESPPEEPAPVAPPEPEPEPAPERVVEPEPEPAPEPVVVRLLPNRTLLRAGACPECGPGEWSVASNWPAAPRATGTVACAPDLAERMERVAKVVEESLPVDFRVYAGALAEPTGNDVLRLLPDEVRGEVQELLPPILDPERSCQVLGIFLPEGARFIGFQYEAADLESRGSCLPDQPCEIGDAAWRGNPVIHSHQHGTFLYGVFENLSPERRREANFKAYFRPPRGWLPPR